MPSMAEIIGRAGAGGKEIALGGDEPAEEEVTILPPTAPLSPRERQAAGVVRRLARDQAVSPALLEALEGSLGEAVIAAAAYAADALSEPTRRAYARDWEHFATWCRSQAADPDAMPVHPVLIASYLGTLAGALGKSALDGRVAAIAHAHRLRGHTWNGRHPAIRATLQGIRRTHQKKVRPAAALCSDEVKQLLSVCPTDLAGMRDRALFLIGLAGAFRRSELVAIDFLHLRFEGGHVMIHVPRSKRDQEGKGADVTIPRMRDPDGRLSETCPVAALEAWLKKARIRRGPVFRSITATARLGERLGTDGVRHILLQRAARAKLTVHPSERLSPHGLRAGFITEAYLSGALDEQVMTHARHADLSTMRGYRRRARVTGDNPARLLKL